MTSPATVRAPLLERARARAARKRARHCAPPHTARTSRAASRLDGAPRIGTTTATILTRAIFSEGCKSVAAGMNPMDLRRGINLAVDAVLTDLKARTKMISTKEEITQVRSMPARARASTSRVPHARLSSRCRPLRRAARTRHRAPLPRRARCACGHVMINPRPHLP